MKDTTKNDSYFMPRIIFLIHSFIIKFLMSLHSIRFDSVYTETDDAIFYTIGKAIMSGKVLYKDIFDHKTPYIYFIDAFVSILDKNHLGLYILEVAILYFTLYYFYRLMKIVSGIKDGNDLRLYVPTFIVSILLTIPSLTFSYSRTEEYAICFLVISIYIFASFFYSADNEFRKKNIFIIGIFAGLTFMTNIRAAVLFVPFAVAVLIRLIKSKSYKNIFTTFVYGVIGVIVSMIPYLIYMVVTNSYTDAYYAIIETNVNYLSENLSKNVSIFNIAAKFIKENLVVYIISFITLISLFLLNYNKFLKYSVLASYIIALIYITFSNRSYSYYLVILYPYWTSIYFLMLSGIRPRDDLRSSFVRKSGPSVRPRATNYSQGTLLMVLTIIVSLLIGFRDLENIYKNHLRRSGKMREAITKRFGSLDNLNVLSFGMNPEVYIYLGIVPKYKFFFIPNVSYEADNTAYRAQYNYIQELSADVIVYRTREVNNTMPKAMQNQIFFTLGTSYDLIETITTNAEEGVYYIYAKK